MPLALVLIAAHDERDRIGACLRALLAQVGGGPLRVVVAADHCRDGTASAAERLRPAFAAAGHDLRVVLVGGRGKPAALNAADEAAGTPGDGPRIYLDADAVLAPDAVAALRAALAGAPPRLAAPRVAMRPPPGALARGYLAVWARLPAVRGDVLGAGCYAVNAAGRRRWGRFPPLIADDGFVRGRFAPDERLIVPSWFETEFPDRRRLLAVLRRWRAGNRQLVEDGLPAVGRPALANLRVLRDPSLWRHAPAFLLVSALVRLPTGRRPGAAWSR